MSKQVGNNEEIEYDDVCLSELRAVVDIYKKAKTKISYEENLFQNNTIHLTENFGLPLVFGRFDKKVIGSASVTLSPNNQVEINCYFREGFEKQEVKQILSGKAKKILDRTFNNDKDNFKVKESIKRWIDWINKCN
ncbi:hypothetical protein [Flavobacterium sp. XS2P39]|uniref:hypothetical protein n=1 Tax=Flavobacterium sp. XS2P39 TaxID=3401725 RepID=UPI003AAD67ED